MFFGKRKRIGDPFWNLGKKRAAYIEFFERGAKKGLEMYLATGKQNYLGGLSFKNSMKYKKGKGFEKIKEPVNFSAIYDRSGGIYFPDKKISSNVLNGIEFKRLCYDKYKTYQLISRYMKKTYLIKSQAELEVVLGKINRDDVYVLKPSNGLGGKGIFVGTPIQLRKTRINGSKYDSYVLQEFVDTSTGIPGVVKGRHDLRIVVVNGRLVWFTVREPRGKKILANVAQGGKIKELDLRQIPSYVIKVVHDIKKIINQKYSKPIYSIDFGVENGKPFVFELNDQIGFPLKNMKNKTKFIDEILNSLEEISVHY